MKKSDGTWGKVLRVNLSRGVMKEERVKESVYKKFLGGSGFGTKVIWEEVSPEVKPFDPENRIVFSVGPLQGTKLPGSAKWCVTSKSPLTGTYAESHCGATFGVMLKKSGYDALIVQGRSEKPVYVWIHDGEAGIRDAYKFWGMDAYEATDALSEDVGEPHAAVATIGPAGERLVKIGCIVVDKHSFAGRCGIGAVMGYKNLKAVVVYGTKDVSFANPERVDSLTRRLAKKIHDFAASFREHGTMGGFADCHSVGDTPIKYWRGDEWLEGVEKLKTPRFTQFLNAKPLPCPYCPIGCHRHIKIKELEGPGPEYETVALLGSATLVDDLEVVARANDICNRLGIDTISAGALVGFAMECYERGWITKEDTNGLQLKWGNGSALLRLIRQIGRKQDFGEIFADGTLKAAERIGKGSKDVVVHVRGLDMPGHDPRACWSLAPTYAVSPRGCCHERGFSAEVELGAFTLPEVGIKEKPRLFEFEGKAFVAMKVADFATFLNSLVICNFMVDGGGTTLTEVVDCANAVTGWGWSVEEYMELGERVFNLQRMVNIRDGVGGNHDQLPKRMFEPAKTGPRAGKVPPFNDLLREYYELRGWDRTGNPKGEKLRELGLWEIVKPEESLPP